MRPEEGIADELRCPIGRRQRKCDCGCGGLLPAGSKKHLLEGHKRRPYKDYVRGIHGAPSLVRTKLTVPTKWAAKIVCTDQCDKCPVYMGGCGRYCNRWPDEVCPGCPCLASLWGKPPDLELDEK